MSEQTPLTAEQLAEITAHRVFAAGRLGDSDMATEDASVFSRALDDSRALATDHERLRLALVARERRDDELRAILARTEIPPGDAGADLWGLGMTVLSHMDCPIYLDDWDPEDRVGALRELIEKLTARVAEVVAESQAADRASEKWDREHFEVVDTARRLGAELAARPSRAEVLREAAEELEEQGHLFAADELRGMADEAEQDDGPVEPVVLRWGLDDGLIGDDGSVTLLLSGPRGEPYTLDLDPARAAALLACLAGDLWLAEWDGLAPTLWTSQEAAQRWVIERAEEFGESAPWEWIEEEPDLWQRWRVDTADRPVSLLLGTVSAIAIETSGDEADDGEEPDDDIAGGDA